MVLNCLIEGFPVRPFRDVIGWEYHLSGFVEKEQTGRDSESLFQLIHVVRNALARHILGKVLTGLADYTKMHFGTEEELMQKYAYPEYAAHKKIHDDLIKQVGDLQAKLVNTPPGMIPELASPVVVSQIPELIQ